MPNRVRALVGVVASVKNISRVDLARRVVPGAENVDQFNNLVRETKRLGLLVENDGEKTLTLADGVSKKQVSSRSDFLAYCRDILIPASGVPCPGNEAFPLALAWLLTRSIGPSLTSGSEFQVELRNDLSGDEIFELTNASRSSMLEYWAHALGFAEWFEFRGSTYCCPDPTRALMNCLSEVLAPRKQTPIRNVIESVAERLPVFETGHFRAEVESRLKVPRDPESLSKSTSLALRRLELSGKVKLETLADAQSFLLSEMDGRDIAISHITLAKS